MRSESGFLCQCCGDRHDELPLAFHAPAPAYWSPELDGRDDCALGGEQCVIGGEHYFIHGLIEVPILESTESFAWGVWVSLSQESFELMGRRWEEPGREHDEPRFGWLSTELTAYQPSTLNLKTRVHTRAIGVRPFIELEPTGHPLALEQGAGITRARAEELAARMLHPAAD